MDRERIVLADDFAAMRTLVTHLLAYEFDIVGTAGTGYELIDQVYRQRPDLIVVDVDMPELDGLEALRRLREGHNKTPAVILTVSTSQPLIEKAKTMGAGAYVVKNRIVEDLIPAIRVTLEGERFFTRL